MVLPFKEQHRFNSRKAESERIRSRYRDSIPIVCEKALGSHIPRLEKQKYLVPADLTIGNFLHVLRTRLKLPSDKAMFVFINEQIPPTAALMGALHTEQQDEDGFLYLTYAAENTFGA
ncbi:hypothetical protein FQN49_003371 [Arthroderma sp. PD_2]|nr:hypothetical protein FQN49_003371 [Arthroderma sp. PD_2]